MSGSLVGRVLRPALLLALALLGVQATAGVVAAPSSPAATTYTRSVSCHGYDFWPLDGWTGFGYYGTLRARTQDINGGEASGFFTCDPGLPNRAVVTKVQFTLKDIDNLAQVRYCGLYRSSLKPSSAETVQTLAQVSSTGLAAQPGKVRKTDNTIAHATVDTTDWAYWLQCRIEFQAPRDGSFAAGIYGADIIYRISSTYG